MSKSNYPSNSNRREFIKTMTAAVLGANIIGCHKNARKPNLLFIWTDEQRADTMACYGNNKIHAPNLNKLASESVVFENAYVSQPVCTPSRSTVMTGLWPHSNSCMENNTPLPKNIPCLPELINDPEYRTGYFGKWHLGDEIFSQHGFEEWQSIEDGYREYYREGRDLQQKSNYWHFLKELGYHPDTADGDFSRAFAAHRTIEHCKPKFLERKACDFLKRHKNEPFILYINFLEPHMPFFGPLNDEHHPDLVNLPANYDDPLENDEPLRYRLLRENYRQKGFGGHDLNTASGWRRLIANYWGLVTQVDLSVGGILETLARLGLADNTIVVYTSDHGDMMGSHRLLAKTVMYEESVKVPLLFRLPWLVQTQKLLNNRTSHIDLVPTLLDLMNRPKESQLPGKSLVPYLKGEKNVNDPVFIQWNPAVQRGSTPHGIASISKDDVDRVHRAHTRTIITQDGWKLCLSDLDNCQLVNLNKDPWETTNLFYSGEYGNIIADLTNQIHNWQERVNDTIDV